MKPPAEDFFSLFTFLREKFTTKQQGTVVESWNIVTLKDREIVYLIEKY
jgi:hypothetical protein